MSTNSDPTTNESNGSTEMNKTDETTREQHLSRMEELEQELFARALEWMDDPHYARPQGPYLQAASLRWLIEREQARNLLPILEPVEEKPFVLTED